MSAYYEERSITERPNKVIPIGNEYKKENQVHRDSEESIVSVFYRMEHFVLAAKQLEESFEKEKQNASLLQEELTESRVLYDRLLSEERSKNHELTLESSKLKASHAQYKNIENSLNSKLKFISEKYKEIRSELYQYKTAWAGVLQREKEAKLIILDGKNSNKKCEELISKINKLEEDLLQQKEITAQKERHSLSYQTELQNTLVRLHSAESKFTELSKEYQVVSQTKKNFEEEIEKVEKSMRERYQWSLVKEKESIRAILEKEAAIEREKFREKTRKLLKAEYESDFILEKAKLLTNNNR